MNKLGYGCMRLPLHNTEDYSSINYEETKKYFDYFLNEGFTYFDTAWMYHASQSERCLKECLVARHDRSKYTITSKLPLFDCKTAEDQERIFNEQLQKVGVDYFDYYLVHNLTKSTIDRCREFDTFNFLRRLKKEGKIKHIGFSSHDNPAFLDMILTENPDIDVVQIQLNYLDMNDPRVQSQGNYEVCLKHNKKIIIMEPVKGGSLAKIPAEAEYLFKNYNKDASVASYAIRYAAGLKNVFMVLSGMSTMEQVIDNCNTMKDFKPITEEENEIIKKVVTIINSNSLIGCTGCNYCQDGCPSNISISEYFHLYNNLKMHNNENYDDLKKEYDHLATTRGLASSCIECKLCEGTCPQHLNITKHLKQIKDIFETR